MMHVQLDAELNPSILAVFSHQHLKGAVVQMAPSFCDLPSDIKEAIMKQCGVQDISLQHYWDYWHADTCPYCMEYSSSTCEDFEMLQSEEPRMETVGRIEWCLSTSGQQPVMKTVTQYDPDIYASQHPGWNLDHQGLKVFARELEVK